MNKRHIHNHGFRLIVVVLLMILMMAGHASAQVKVKGNVYGGGNLANVGQSVTVNVKAGEVEGDVYGGGAKAHTNTANWDDGTSTFTQTYHQVMLALGTPLDGYFMDEAGANAATGTADGSSTYYKKTETIVNLTGGEVKHDVYGGGLGYNDAEDNSNDAPANVYGDVTVTTTGGKARDVFGANNVLGTPKGVIAVNINGTADDGVRNVYGGGNQATYEGSSTTVTVTAGKAVNVYGGGLSADVAGSVAVNIQGGTVTTDVYGGGALGHTNTGNWNGAALASTYATIVNLTDGTIGRNVYGGGLGEKAVEDNPATSDVDESYAGIAALVYGDVTVNIGATDGAETPTYTGNITIGGSVFGCNNANGTPKGDVLVNVYRTAHTSGENNNQYLYDGDKTPGDLELDDDTPDLYAIQAVYGGGNLADYTPVAPTGSDPVHSTTVHVYVCDQNTVKAVYGGGNAADVGTGGTSANTNVIIEGGRFYNVFGGGNGAGDDNPGANIYGTAKTEIKGGLFNQVFGGSDTKGNVGVVDLSIESDEETTCTLRVNEAFGGANRSDLTGDVITTLTCSDNITIGNFYGGSNQADINGNVTLNVYGGIFKNVYGGSKGKTVAENATNEEKEDASADISGNVTLNLFGGEIKENAYGGSNVNGRIGGKITVNVLDGGNCALDITGNIYGAGNITPYAPTYNPTDLGETELISPVVNLIHGTVANVFGGAEGATAEVTSNPQVNIGYDADLMGSDFTTSGTLLYELTHLSDGTADPNFNFEIDPSVFAAVVTGNVYGGGDLAQVTGNTVVNLRKANSSVANIFGGGNKANVTRNSTVNILAGTVGTLNEGSLVAGTGNVYGGGALADVGTDGNDATQVTITGGTVRGSIYGGGLGQVAADAVPAIAALVNGAVTVTVNGGTVHDVYGCNNENGRPTSTVTVNINNNVGGNVYGGGNLAAYTGNPAVNVNHGTVTHSVYGGGKGSTAVVTGNPIVTIGDNNAEHYAIVTENVYGGGDAAAVTGNTTVAYNDNNASSTVANLFGGGNAAGVSSNTSITFTSGKVTTAVYGGCNTSGTVGGTSTVTVTAGTIGTAFASAPDPIPDVLFGGGKGSATSVTGQVTLNVGTKVGSTYTGDANIYGNVYGGSENGEVHAVDVNLYGNTIYGNVFGGGYSTASNKTAATAVNVVLDGTIFNRSYDGTAQIFGCNNLVGTPLGQVNVHVFRTVAATNGDTYHVAAVYGGGNEADYVPTASGVGNTQVIIEGCNQTSIKDVYGGGNAAAVPGTEVWILGSTIIDKVYGGGNGENGAASAAHVGYHRDSETTKHEYTSGTGKSEVFLVAGTIHDVYGGSNSNGNVRVGADVKTATQSNYTTKFTSAPTPDCCSKLKTDHIYGGGSQAEMEGDAKVILECMPEDFVAEVFGGAQNANVNGSVELTVTSGRFGRVFGGNNTGGNINGSITVNVYEDGCKPLIIGELYGAGNNAPYSIYGLAQNGTPNTSGDSELEGTDAVSVNVFSCTSIGKVYGGGKGETAKVVGNTHVWINMLNGIIDGTPKTEEDNPDDYIGKIGQVFGGGSAADIIGSTTIDIGTATVHPNNENKELIGVNIVSGNFLNPTSDVMNNSVTAGIYGGGEAADVDGNTTLNIGTKNLSEGTNINGDIFGGGLGSGTHVTGDVTVNIGEQDATTGDYVGYANITGDVYGGSAKGKVNSKLVSSVETPQTGKTTQVNFYGGTLSGTNQGNIYGGGLGDADHAANVYGAVAVNLYGGTANNVFGCNNVNGAPQNTVTVTMNGGTINNSIYGGGNQAAYSVENNPNKDQANAYKKYPAVNINNGTVTENVFGGGLGLTATVTANPHVTIGDNEEGHTVAILKSVYGGGELATVDGNTNIVVNSGTIGTPKDGETVYGGATYGNIYGGGFGNDQNVRNGLVKGNTEVTVNGGTILHNIYGGGAYGSVGTYTYASENANAAITGHTNDTGKATITILGGTIGTDGDENGMVFGSSRGDIDAPGAIQDNMAWVHDTEVIIGTEGDGENVSTPLIKGSVYGGGENGHTYNNTSVTIYSGRIGIDTGSPITNPDDAEHPYTGAAYPYRGNVYGGGCGTDKYYSNPAGVEKPHDGKGDTYNQMAGIVRGTTTVFIDGGHVVRNVYGAGAMGSVGATDNTGAIVNGGSTSITISGGTIGVSGVSGSDGDGNVFGAARGNSTTTQQKSVALVKTTGVTISGNADVKGSVYGGGEIGNVGTYTTSADGTNTYPEGSGVCAVTVSGGTVRGNVFGAGKGIADSFTSERAMVNSTTVTISNGTVEQNVYGGGEIGRVENNTVVAISAGEIKGSVFGAGQGVTTHGYSGLVRGNSTVTIQGNAKVRQNVYGGGETATVGKYWIKGADYTGVSGVPTPPEDLPSGMPYATRADGVCTVNVLGNAQVGPDAGASETVGHVFGAGKGVEPGSYTYEDDAHKPYRMDNNGDWEYFTLTKYLEFLQSLALVTNSYVTIDGSAQVKGNVYGGSESGFVQDNTNVTIQGGTIGTTTYGNVYGGGKGLPTFVEAGKVKGATSVAISGGTTNGNVYGGGQLGYVQQNVTVNMTGGTVVNDVYGGGALANTNTDNWDATKAEVEYVKVDRLIVDTEHPENSSPVTGYYVYNHTTGQYDVTSDAKAQANKIYYEQRNITGTWADGKNEANSTTYKTRVNVTGGIVGNVYGGGLGRKATAELAAVAAMVYGDVEVTINKEEGNGTAVFTKIKEATNAAVNKTGRVFGCNNLNGSPKGNVTVTVWDTYPLGGVKQERDEELYDLQAVYGGGNLAEYIPIAGKKTRVNIHGCNTTSIEYVFGGGNAAIVPNTEVVICGCYEIGTVFGGGNGSEPIWDYSSSPGRWIDNSGANVPGTARVTLLGGYIHSAFGGSYERGFCGATVLEKPSGNSGRCEHDDCRLQVTDVYGGGQKADTGIINLTISGCTYDDEVTNVYAASYNARVLGDVTLNIWGGKFENVFGGNKDSGLINGKITINIEEVLDETCTNNKPIEIKNLYGGCNAAPYPGPINTLPEKEGDPNPITDPKITINVISCTSIGNIYGGSLQAPVDCNTEININMIKGYWAGKTYNGRLIPDALGAIGNVYGGGNRGQVNGNTVVNIGSSSTVHIWKRNASGKLVDAGGNEIYNASGVLNEGKSLNIVAYEDKTVLGANITGDVYGGGNVADVTGNTYVNICAKMGSPVLDANDQPTGAYTYSKVAEGTAGVKIGGSVYGGGCESDVKSNTFVKMSDGYVFNGIFGGGLAGSVGTVTDRSLVNYDGTTHTSHTGCLGGKPKAFAVNTGKCTIVVDGGQIGPIEVATKNMGMNRPKAQGGPVIEGWVWGGSCGVIEDPSVDPDIDFRSYVGSTDVTIGGTAFILESVIGGGEFGRVLGDTKVTIKDHCQIGVGEGMVKDGKPVRYTDGSDYGNGATTNQFIDPTTTEVTNLNALPECSHFPYGRNIGTEENPNWVYLPFDPYYDKYPTYVSQHSDLVPASTANPSDGKTWIGCVFGGGSGYMPYDNGSGYDWIPSAGLVEGDTHVFIEGGHILTNVYGANEYTDVKGTARVKMTGGTIGVPRTLEQIAAHPVTCYLFGAGKGDERSHFYNYTNVGNVEVEVSGGIIYGSVFGGSEDGHVLGNVTVTIKDKVTVTGEGDDAVTTTTSPIIGTWGTSYVDGNVFGGGRGFSGTSLTAGNVGGNVEVNISGGTMLGSIYGGGRLGSVGYDLEGVMSDDSDRGHVTVNISGGTIGNNHEFEYTPTPANVPYTLYEDGKLMHTKGGNVFVGGMGRRTKLDGVTPLPNWQKLGNVKSTKLNISGTAWIKGNVYGGGEFGAVTGSHAVLEDASPVNDAEGHAISAGTEIIIRGGVVGTMMEQGTAGSAVNSAYTGSGDNRYTFGSIYGGGYGTEVEVSANPYETDVEKFGAYVNTNTYIKMSGSDTKVRASVYGGGEMACVKGNTYVNVVDGYIGIGEVRATAGPTQNYVLFGSWKMGNVYGAGKGSTNAVRSGLVMGNTNVDISGGYIYHNVYGGGAYGSVGTFTTTSAGPIPTEWTSGGKATVKITAGTIGINGWDNGMVNGSSRGDVSAAAFSDPYDKLAWVHDTEVTIGTSGSGPAVKGSVYGGGENGHNFANAVVNVHGGTIGVLKSDATWGSMNISSRGNVYGAGCGTDTYWDDADHDEVVDAGEEHHNAIAGIVLGNTNVTIDGGQVLRNVYGGGSMGSVGTFTKDDNGAITITDGGTTNITISGGTIGVDGDENGNVFGAVRGDETTSQTGVAFVKTTGVTISGTADVKGNVYGGGEIGDVGTYSTLADGTKTYLGGSGACFVNVTGGTVRGNVFGAGKGSDKTFQCEKAMVKDANVSVSNGTVNGNVYGGGEVGRVENDTKVTIGRKTDETEGNGTGTPDIKGNVFGGGKGVATHGYSALTRGNTEVTIEGGADAKVRKNVYGGGEIASVGRYGLNDEKKPDILLDGGKCEVKVQGNAVIGPDPAQDQEGNVFGAGKGIDIPYNHTDSDHSKRSRRMVSYDSSHYTNDNQTVNGQLYWEYSDDTHNFVWEYFKTEEDYQDYLTTLALTTEPDVTIDGNATVNGSVFGGGELGLTKGSVTVTIKGGTMMKDVYGGGALANTNTTKTIGVKQPDGSYQKDGKYVTTTYYATTNVYLQGGLVYGDAYGGGLGQKGTKVVGVKYTQEEADAYNTEHNLTSGDEGFVTTENWKIAPVDGTDPIEADTFGEINVYLGGDKDAASTSATAFNISYLTDDNSKKVVNSGRVFGCNNRNGSPREDVTVTVWKTVSLDAQGNVKTKPTKNTNTYEVAAVYGGGNLAPFTAGGKKTHVIIHGCDATSIETVYGGGNAAAVPEASVDVYSCYEIGSVFGGGNGKDKYTLDGGSTWVANPGANVNGSVTTMLYGGTIHKAYGGSNELGTITGSVFIDASGDNPDNCDLVVDEIVGAGKNADVNGDLIVIMGCKPETRIPVVYGGANDANVNGNVELTITSGTFGKVFGGNNLGGAIKGHIKLTIEETSCTPTTIEELYLGGNEAAYSKYGYYVKTTENSVGENPSGVGAYGEHPVLKDGRLILLPRVSATDTHLPVDTYTKDGDNWAWTVKPITGDGAFTPYADPELNIISCTSIGQVYGGGFGEAADMYANPTVNINMIPGAHAVAELGGAHKLGAVGTGYTDKQNVEHEGGVFGGGNEAAVYGNTTVNIGTVNEVYAVYPDLVKDTNVKGYYTYNNGEYELITTDTYVTEVAVESQKVYYYRKEAVEGANIVSNVYGGGNLADVTGNTYVNVCAVNNNAVTISGTDYEGVTIKGNVFGGGKGIADSFECAKAMIGKEDDGVANPDGGTAVNIYNGTVLGSVYGGGMIGRVEKNTVVTIGKENADEATSKPVVKGSVFGAGKGVATHGYAALVRGNSTVTIQGFAKVGESVYGGGEIASVGRYNLVDGVPTSLKNENSGNCFVTVRDNAEIGPDNMTMFHIDESGNIVANDQPDNSGHVFGAGKGAMPYIGIDGNPWEGDPWSINKDNGTDTYNAATYGSADAAEAKYLKFIETLGLATQTKVTISENAFVKGDVFGGAEQGFVQHDTKVTIEGNCQIGNGYVQMNADGGYLARTARYSLNRRYTDEEWSAGKLTGVDGYENSLPECASWEYASPYAPHDDFADKYESKGGALVATNGSTFYGNVFGGGSGYFSYAPGKWHWKAGDVGGNTIVEIKGGHVLTNVYGGNELTNVTGKCTVTMSGGTIGVPRTLGQIAAHPVTCYLFGGGKGDPRVLFNKQTNVNDVEVNITGGWIYGSAFGGGEDGHVMRDVTMKIGGTAKIGTWGTSYVDGNVFGGGRGFAGDAYTAGNVAGSVDMTISGGTMLGSIYGGGRLGSVGYGLYEATETGKYGTMRPDDYADDGTTAVANFKRGYVTMKISGGTIGNTNEFIMPNATNIAALNTALSKTLNTDFTKWTDEVGEWTIWKKYYNVPYTEYDKSNGRLTHTKGGNVYAGGMGRYVQLDGTTPISAVDWWKLGSVKSTTLNISGTPWIMGNVYGGGEMGAVIPYNTTQGGTTSVTITGGTIGTEVTGTTPVQTTVPTTTERSSVLYTYGSVYGGGMGMEEHDAAERHGGEVSGNTTITMSGENTEVRASVFGGGEMAVVDGNTTVTISNGKIGRNEVKPMSDDDAGYVLFGGATMGNVYGGGKGKLEHTEAGLVKGNTNVNISGGNIYHMVYGGGALGSVGTFTVSTGTGDEAYVPAGIPLLWTEGTGTATVNITGGTIGISGRDNGLVFGSSRGGLMKPVDGLDPYDRVAWVNKSVVNIGTAGQGIDAPQPQIKCSVYGGGENGHNNESATVNVYSGTIGITDPGDPWYNFGTNTVNAKALPYRGNVYGAGSGADTYTGDDSKKYYNPKSGMVAGNTFVNIYGGLVGRAVYGGGAMASIGKMDDSYIITDGGIATVEISGGTIGVNGTDNGNVFGAARGDATSTQVGLALVKTTGVTISGTAAVKGNVYGGGENGDVQGNTIVDMQGGTIAKNVFGGGDKADVKGNTNLSMTGGIVGQNVYGGGQMGSIGTFIVSDDMRTFTWTDKTAEPYDYNNTGVCTVTISGGKVGPDNNTNKEIGNVFGGGKGEANTFWCEKAMAYDAIVNVNNNATVNGNVYGGGEVGRVENDTQVTVGDEDKNETAVSADNYAPVILGSVFGGGAGVETHGYSALVRGNTEVTVQGHAKIGHNVYGGGETAAVGRYRLDKFQMPSYLDGGGDCTVNVLGYAKIGPATGAGHVFGAGKGIDPTDADHAGVSYSSKTFKRMMVYSTDFVTGKTAGTDWDYYEPDHNFIWHYLTSEADYASYLETLALATAPTVSIAGNASVTGDVYGGGERGITKGAVIVNINGGTIANNVYGGGALANTNVANWVKNETTHNWEWLDSSLKSALHTTTVNLHSGTINGNVYGGGLGSADVAPMAYGDVLVELNKESADNCYVPNLIFGGNNLNGSPQGHAKVHVYKTVNSAKTSAKDPTKTTPEDRVAFYKVENPPYDVAAVYGGGNQADYRPISTDEYVEVVIDGCELTSIENVYGGGNAAATPATEVKINGCYIIDNVFGGGNGTVQAANVGYNDPGEDEDDTDDYITKGTAKTNLSGGYIHKVFGGSNTNGNILKGSFVTSEKVPENDCDLKVSEVFGGGNEAPMKGGTEVVLGCMPNDWIDEIYAGAQNADVTGDVMLTITSGKFGRVFGGNKSGGILDGGIVVNIEENPTCDTPIVIGEVYGGGNEAPYSAYGYTKVDDEWQLLRKGETGANATASPVVVHAKAFTSIGKIFGGGKGDKADLIGNPWVLVDEVEGGREFDAESVSDPESPLRDETLVPQPDGTLLKTLNDGTDVTLYPRAGTGTMGVVGTIFGGGNEAEVEGNTTVKIASYEYVVFWSAPELDDVRGFYTRSRVDDESPYVYEEVTGEATVPPAPGTLYFKKVQGADIRGNIYGGGNDAEVTGDTNVVIGRKAE